MCRCIGYILNKERRLLLSLMVNVLEIIDNSKHKWIVLSTYCTIFIVLLLQGCGLLIFDFKGLRKFWEPNRYYTVIALLQRIKGEIGEIYHLMPCVDKTGSVIEVFRVVERMIMEKNNLKQLHGPVISNKRGQFVVY